MQVAVVYVLMLLQSTHRPDQSTEANWLTRRAHESTHADAITICYCVGSPRQCAPPRRSAPTRRERPALMTTPQSAQPRSSRRTSSVRPTPCLCLQEHHTSYIRTVSTLTISKHVLRSPAPLALLCHILECKICHMYVVARNRYFNSLSTIAQSFLLMHGLQCRRSRAA